jgi:hypothetical protein
VGIAGSGMLKTFSASEAAEFVGIGRQVLADADAVALLSANDLKILKNGINIYENGLYRIKYDIEIAKDVNRAKSIIKYFDNEVLRTEIFALDEVNKLRFLDDFGTASDLFKVGLTDHPEYVNIWSNYSEEQKLLAKTDPVQSLKSELQNIRFHRKYVWIEGGLPPIPTPEEVLANYGSKELALYNNVEELVIAIRSGIQKSSFGDFVLISGMVDTESGMYSELFSNFLKDEYYTNYINFLSNQGPGANLANEYLQPNMAEILGIAKIKKEAGEYVFENPELVSNTGNRIGSHAEFRALNNLAAKKFGNIKIDEIEFDHWLTKVVGYNSYIRRAGCQQPCADCFYLTALIKYIKK